MTTTTIDDCLTSRNGKLFIDELSAAVIRRAETLADVFARDVVPEHLRRDVKAPTRLTG